MFQVQQLELARLEHSHGDDKWYEMHPATPSHDPSETDPEREWARGRIYRCGSCEEEIRVVLPDPSPIEGAVTPPAP